MRTTDLSNTAWRKSSYSNADGGQCLEVADPLPLSAASWRKSSYSNQDGGACVEVADHFPSVIPVRDSKTAPDGPTLLIEPAAWTSFVAALKRGSRFSAPARLGNRESRRFL